MGTLLGFLRGGKREEPARAADGAHPAPIGGEKAPHHSHGQKRHPKKGTFQRGKKHPEPSKGISASPTGGPGVVADTDADADDEALPSGAQQEVDAFDQMIAARARGRGPFQRG